MKRLFFIILAIFVVSQCVLADDARTVSLQIKKSADFIYGESAGRDFDATRDVAFDQMFERVKRFVQTSQSIEGLRIDVDELRLNSHMICYQRGNDINVVLYFIEKDVLLKKKEAGFSHVTSVDKIPASSGATVVSDCDEHVETVLTVPSVEGTPESIPKERPEPQVTEQVASASGAITSIHLPEIISEILRVKNYDELLQLKRSRTDFVGGLTKTTTGFTDCYWVVMDQNKNVIAVIGPDNASNLLNNQSCNLEQYKNYPKFWIQIIK